MEYTIAVAAIDSVGNQGQLSEPTCATPMEVDDFFELYRDAGGEAGGGFCSCGIPGRHRRGLGALGLLAAFAIAGAARRRRRS